MSITDVTLIWSGEGSQLSKELDFETPGDADFVEVYDCLSDDGTDNTLDVRTASGVPAIGDQKGSEYLWVTNVNVTREHPRYFRVIVTYKSFAIDPEDPTENPLLAPAKVKWKTVKANGEIDEDADGNPIATTAGEPVQGIMRPFGDIAAVITQSFAAFNSFSFYDFMDHVNIDPFLGWPAGTCKVDDIGADPQKLQISGGTLEYYNVTVIVQMRKPIRTTPDRAWYNRRALKGNYVLDGSGNQVPALIDGEQAPGPVYLDENGEQTTQANAIYVEDKIFANAQFSNMGFNFG